MAYNQDLEYRIDLLTERFGKIVKKKMFGGICYLLNGNMCFGIYREYLIVRTSKDKAEDLLLNEEHIKPFDITGKPMKGWVMVSSDVLEAEDELLEMLKLGISFAHTLPKR